MKTCLICSSFLAIISSWFVGATSTEEIRQVESSNEINQEMPPLRSLRVDRDPRMMTRENGPRMYNKNGKECFGVGCGGGCGFCGGWGCRSCCRGLWC